MKYEMIKATLEPIEKWLSKDKYDFEKLIQLLTNKLKNTPDKLIVTPKAHIAVPAIKYANYTMENEELCNVYVTIIASAMNKMTCSGVHPAFPEIAKQLSVDEIKILKYMAVSHSIPVLSVIFEKENGEELEVIRDFSLLPKEVGCKRVNDGDLYMENLIRLGLVRKARPLQKLETSEYEPLKADPHVVEYSSERMVDLYGFDKCKFEESYIDLSTLGKGFCAVCLDLNL